MTDKLIEHNIKPGEFRVKRASTDTLDWEEREAHARMEKNLAAALKAHTMIGIDTAGFEVWVI